MPSQKIRRLSTATLLAGLAGSVWAHPGHGPHELIDIFTHAFGTEQLLILAGVGVGVLVLRRWRARRHDRLSNHDRHSK